MHTIDELARLIERYERDHPEILEYRSWLEQYFALDRAETERMHQEHDEYYENIMSNATWIADED